MTPTNDQHRRHLKFTRLGEAVADAQGLHASGYQRLGNWDLAQTCDHLTQWMVYPLDGYPVAPLPMRLMLAAMRITIGRAIFRQVVETGTMRPGSPTMPDTVFEPGRDEAGAVERFRRAVDRFSSHTGPLHPSPLFGNLTHKEALQLQLVHCAHHLGFLLPSGKKSPAASNDERSAESGGSGLSIVPISGEAAIETLDTYRAQYASTGMYPFLIGDAEEREILEENAELSDGSVADVIKRSMSIDLEAWMAEKRAEAEECEFSADDILGEWPGEIPEKGSIGLHKDILTGKIKREVFVGLAKIDEPWQLPAAARYGGWNDCPFPEVHCAFHRDWFERYGAEITGISGDVIECVVHRPPTDREPAIELAWEQYWYCADIVDQGCGSISNLAATLLNSNYWYFWWD